MKKKPTKFDFKLFRHQKNNAIRKLLEKLHFTCNCHRRNQINESMKQGSKEKKKWKKNFPMNKKKVQD